MKHNHMLHVLIFILFCFCPYSGWAADIPVCFWQLADQDKYVYRSDLEELHWKEIRDFRKRHKTAREDPKYLTLTIADGIDLLEKLHPFVEGLPKHTTPFLRDPDGVIRELTPLADTDHKVRLPVDDDLIGRYILGATIDLEPKDVDGDGSVENVRLCAKVITIHYKADGNRGKRSVVFFDDVKRMPLEIGPVVNTAKSRFGGGTQRAHRDYEMMVKYKNTPLANAEVIVVSTGGHWKKRFVTDKNGIFEITPTDDRLAGEDWDQYVYTATHLDKNENTYYAATFPTTIYKNRPEWRSKTIGFLYWSILGCVLMLLTVFGFTKRSSWRKSRRLTVFKNYSIKRTNHTDDQV